MNGRLWYPQLDTYDAVHRMVLLLYAWPPSPLGLERFFLLDFYLVSSPLLHQTSMTVPIRAKLAQSAMPHPEKILLSFPTPTLLFYESSETCMLYMIKSSIVGSTSYVEKMVWEN